MSDFRLLLAAIHTIVEPISVVRGRCYVRHKDKIEDLIKWKHTPDHFYFVKFFDPYIKREYEVLRTANVNNSRLTSLFRSNSSPTTCEGGPPAAVRVSLDRKGDGLRPARYIQVLRHLHKMGGNSQLCPLRVS